MSKKIKLQDLSIANFDQQPDVEVVKGGAVCLWWDKRHCVDGQPCYGPHQCGMWLHELLSIMPIEDVRIYP